MAAILTGCLGAVGGKVGELILGQFKYLYCYSAIITNLRNEAEKLKRVVISGEVETWLQKSNEIKREIDGILNEVPNVGSGCFSLGARFSLSKRAEETTDRLKELLDEYRFDTNPISLQRPPAAMPIPSGITYEFKSRKKIEEDIMATLRSGDVNMIGICGMGGLGKTTMAKRIMNRALKEGVFEDIVMAVVSRNVDDSKIQLEIGGSLGLKLEGESSQGRVQKLHKRLSRTEARILLVLDDVWKELVLEDLGIPSSYKGCTILLTSRNHDVLSAMKVKILRMEFLSVEDSWNMFRERVGKCVDDTDELNSLARKVVNECKGLPLALTAVGAALQDEVGVNAWKNAVERLEKGDPDIPEYIEKVYKPLKLSYDVLERKYQDVFLLCCVYPEDADIPLEQLTYFCMGLRIATGNVEAARNRIRAWTKVLKNRSLLLDSEKGDEYVRMHDVVRDVCIYIANKQGYIGDNDLTSSLQSYKFRSGFELLRIRDSDEESNCDGINRDLHVLSIERCSQLTSLPFTQRPNNLITLVLDSCEGLETLSVVGELVNLEILICRDCDSIEELPPEIKRLNRLKVLDLTKCRNLKRIGRGIISSLVGLEELKMLESFQKWEAEDREESENAGLGELVVLNKLRCLEIDIEDFELATKKIILSSKSKVDRFTIRFSGGSFPSISDKYLPKRKMSLELQETTSFEHWKPFLRETECLILSGNGANKVCLPELEKIRHLELGWCESMKNVVTSMDDGGGAIVFPVSLNCFQILKELKLSYLPALKQLWKSSQNDLGKDFLPQLEVLDISDCEKMEAVFLWKGEDGNENTSCHPITKSFPKLKEVRLYQLPNLISLCQGIEGIEFPLLWKLDVIKCRKMKGMVSNENNSGGGSSNADIHGLFCPQQVSFGCLKELEVDDGWNPFCSHTIDVSLLNGLEELRIFKCAGSLSLFTSSMAGNLVNLKYLWIEECDEMVEVIKDDEEKGMSGCRQRALLFPKLHTLKLIDLPKLVSFCEWKCDIEFPSLSFFHGNGGIEFPLLRTIEIYRCNKMKGMVANGMSNENNSEGRNNNAADTSESQQVSFGCLKRLETDRNPFCSHTIHVSIFNGLEELSISQYTGNLSLFTSSMAGNLVNLKKLWIEKCDEMVEVIKDDEEKGTSGGRQRAPLLFPKLHGIYLLGLSKLVSFCELKCDVEFPSLRYVLITRCPNMKNFTLGSLAAPNLESFVTDLNNYLLQVPFNTPKELSVSENENPLNCYQIHGSVFDRLEVLNIDGYKGSMSLFSSSITGNLVNLTTLTIVLCDKMVKVIEEKEEEKEKVVSGAQRTTILFPKLQKIELRYLPELVRFCEWKCDVELPSLREVKIKWCHNMKSFTLGPLNTPNLEFVEIEDKAFCNVKDLNGLVQLLRDTECLSLVGECESMKKVVTSSMDKGGATVFPSIEHLNLFKLPKLEEIWDDRIWSISFQKLKILKLVKLPVLKQLWMSSQNDLGKDFLPQLEVLQIRKCGMMETVFLWKGEDGNENISCHHITKIFPKLKELELVNLPNLISLCQGIEGIEFPLLSDILMSRCGKMTANEVTNNENNSGGTHHIFCESRVSFGCLKKLNTDQNPFCSHTIHVSIFNGLEELRIFRCAGSRSLFTSSMAGNLVNLKELKIEYCEEMVEVIKDDEEKGMNGGQRTLLFPKLHLLYLLDLPKLVSFCNVEFPSLRRVDIRNCPNMKNFTLGSLAAPNLESFKTDLKDYLLQVPFNSMKELSVEGNGKPLNCYQIHGSVFDRLEVLEIRKYKGSMSLFSSSITGNLVNLTTLTISSCDKMVKVIEEKEEEKEKVVSGAQRTTILFPKLHKIELSYLPKLVRFCEWKCDVELPSLRRVEIFLCHYMKSFTLGPLNTPKLESVRIDGEEFGGVKDLNDILQQQYINRTEEKQAEEAEKKKGGEEEQEREGETEDEQN